MNGLLAFQRVPACSEKHSGGLTTASGMAPALEAGTPACGREMVGGRESAEEGGSANGTKSGKRTLRQLLAARDAELAILVGVGVRQRIAEGESGKVRMEVLTRGEGRGMALRPTFAATECGHAAEQVAGRVTAQSQT